METGNFFKKNWRIFLILLLASFLRLYRIRELSTFLADQGTDFLNVASMVIDHRPRLLGPTTSLGIYLGPIYYYFLIPVFLLFKGDPVGPAYFFAIMGILTVFLIYKTCEEFLSKKIGFLAALLYAVSPQIMESSRDPSQPHLIPFFSMVLIYSFLKITRKKRDWYLILIAICLAVVIQLNYSAYPLFIFTLTGLLIFKPKISWRSFLLTFLAGMAVLAPLLTFEIRHQFFITNSLIKFFVSGKISLLPFDLIRRVLHLSYYPFQVLLANGSRPLGIIILVFIIVSVLVNWQKSKSFEWKLLGLFFLVNILGLAVYYKAIRTHYICALYPPVCLFLGIAVYSWQSIKNLKVFSLVFYFLLFGFNLTANDLTRQYGHNMPEGWNLVGVEKVTEIISKDTEDLQFNITATLDGDFRAMPYRYLLKLLKSQPLGVEQYPEAEVLYVVSRLNKESVLRHQVWEISSFRPQGVEKTWHIQNGINLYKLKKR